jgi:hypothetical protein
MGVTHEATERFHWPFSARRWSVLATMEFRGRFDDRPAALSVKDASVSLSRYDVEEFIH